LAGISWNPRENVVLPVYPRPRGHYDEGARRTPIAKHSLLKIGWLPTDASHPAEHAGAASSFFASIFVVATLSMRTMIPLRVFGILTNIILIASAIPTRNYPTLML
jgi:hypothetical protein